jgi:hypothetical protein
MFPSACCHCSDISPCHQHYSLLLLLLLVVVVVMLLLLR